MTAFIALLRGINVGGNRSIRMSDLCRHLGTRGFTDVRSYLASGNILLRSEASADTLSEDLERAIAEGFGFHVDVVVRSAAAWQGYLDEAPFEEEGRQSPNLVMLTIGKQAATDDDLASIRARASGHEVATRRGDALWLFYGDGAGRSKMPMAPPRGIWTTRNLRTLRTTAAMLSGADDQPAG